MIPNGRSFAVALLLALTAARGATEAAPPAATVDEVLRALDDAEAALAAFRVEADIAIKMESPLARGEYADLEARVSLLFDRSGRFRFSERGATVNWSPPRRVHPIRIEAAYDGAVLKQMEGSEKLAHGLVSSRPTDSSMRLDPRNFVLDYQGKTVARWLREYDGKIVGDEPVDGGTALVLETRPNLVDGIEWKQRYLVLPDKGFAVARRSALLRYAEAPDWLEYTRTESFDLADRGRGIHLPARGVYQSWNVKKDDALEGARSFPISWRYDLTFRDWRINPDATDADFTLRFEPGVFVNDRISGRSYEQGR
ncbi:hypothetical protein [Paludisphaera sp.]|uniref:hypothetical protein n=1 Tax=Paludisphaera sp. TaxID=2017432 RepID=UPI00301C13A5